MWRIKLTDRYIEDYVGLNEETNETIRVPASEALMWDDHDDAVDYAFENVPHPQWFELEEVHIFTTSREAASPDEVLDEYETVEEAEEAIMAMYEEDKELGYYQPDFYLIVDQNGNVIKKV